MAKPEPDYEAEMKTPPGKTCDDCAHARRCFMFGFSQQGRGSCDFWPSRFRLKIASPTPTAVPGRETE